MVDVTVDQKPTEKLPYDPNDIPDAVKKRVAAVEEFYKQNGSDGQQQPPSDQQQELQSPQEPPAVQVPATPAVSSPTPAPTSTPATPPAPDDNSAEAWRRRFLRMQGQYTAQQKTIGEMQNQMEQLGTELMHVQQQPKRGSKRAPVPRPNFLTPEDEQNFGPELLDVAQRAAMQTVAPKIHEIEQQNTELQRQLAAERRRALDQQVEISVPDYREIDRNPRWHRWLLGIDVFTGRVRQTLLNDAIASASAPRVISFFNGFKAEEAATGHAEPVPASRQTAVPREPVIPLASLATPGRARPATGGDASLPSDKPSYTRAQVKLLYEQHRKGAYVGREAEWARIEADMFAAQREGRYRT